MYVFYVTRAIMARAASQDTPLSAPGLMYHV